MTNKTLRSTHSTATTTTETKPPLSRLEKLQQQRDKLTKKIELQKTREANAERKRDTRRKILVGATLITEAETNTELYDTITRLLNRYLTREDDRKLFPDIPPMHRKDQEEKDDKATA